MKMHRIGILILAAVFVFSSFATVPAHEQRDPQQSSTAIASPPTLRINLASDPVLDPSKAASSDSIAVVEQLFIGLFDIDEQTGAVKPELATSWTVSPDGLTYIFTLRDDVYWTDGNPVTAFDVRYGILRTLNPNTGANYAYVLFIIDNAQEFNGSLITDPAQVGVTALDATHLKITLVEPAAYLPTILGLWVARPMPQSVIETWGETWTEPGHLIVNGAYKLSEWVHDDHLTLEKNSSYYDQANVQIEKVDISLINNSSTAWAMYLNGEFDTATVPLTELGNLDPITKQEYHRSFGSCNYYYGFVNTKPPFDDVNVRKAFVQSIDRQSLIDKVLKGGQIPATSFAPPGIFGAPEPGTVGLPYDPDAARASLQTFLDENGMTIDDFNALGIVLMHNTGESHARIAAAIQQMWKDVLGVDVKVENQEWAVYLDTLNKTTPVEDVPHVFRMGWCTDYPDENNWIHEVFNNLAGPNRLRRGCLDPNCNQVVPQEFDQLTWQAKVEQDPEVRKNLYLKAERILAEQEAAYLPLFFYSQNLAAKIYLKRTYPTFGAYDIATWRLTQASTTIEPGGGSLSSYDGNTAIDFPSGVISETVQITHTPTAAALPTGNMKGVGEAFDLSVEYAISGQPAQLLPGSTYSITIQYSSEDKGPVIETSLGLYYWDGEEWVEEPSSSVDTGLNMITATPDHFSIWRVFGETKQLFLPFVGR